VSSGGVFVVETKAVRKPAKAQGRADAKVVLKGGKLVFPHFTTDYPLIQAQQHADYLCNKLRQSFGDVCIVKPVVALPGWFVTVLDKESNVLVINPKRGSFLSGEVSKSRMSPELAEKVACYVEEYSRDVHNSADKLDPDAGKRFTFLLDRKPEDRRL
jgi:hypothetical protein